MTNTINTLELRRLRSMNTAMLLVDVLPKDKFDKDHIEGAQNIPLDSADFVAKVERAAGNKEKKVVVYCSGVGSDASTKAAAKLTAAGHRDVAAYEGGITAWRNDAAKPASTPVGAGVASAASATKTSADKPAAPGWSGPYDSKSAPVAKPAVAANSGAASNATVPQKPVGEQKKVEQKKVEPKVAEQKQ